MNNLHKINALENTGMIDLAFHQLQRFKSVHNYINAQALWQKWIRR